MLSVRYCTLTPQNVGFDTRSILGDQCGRFVRYCRSTCIFSSFIRTTNSIAAVTMVTVLLPPKKVSVPTSCFHSRQVLPPYYGIFFFHGDCGAFVCCGWLSQLRKIGEARAAVDARFAENAAELMERQTEKQTSATRRQGLVGNFSLSCTKCSCVMLPFDTGLIWSSTMLGGCFGC